MRSVSIRSVAIMFGAAALMLAGAAEAKSFRPLYQFAGGNDGNSSVDRLLLDSAGNLYGVTTATDSVLGTVFMLSPGGTETVLHAFQYTAQQASLPTGGVVMDAQGNLYGEAVNGGAYFCPDIALLNPDCGSVYKLATDGTMTTIHSFQGSEDGAGPTGGLLIDSAGNLYGTTKMGGSGNFCTGGCGSVFKLTPDGTNTVLYNFAGQSDGARPTGSLIADAAGNLYGTTSQGGTATAPSSSLLRTGPRPSSMPSTGRTASSPPAVSPWTTRATSTERPPPVAAVTVKSTSLPRTVR